VVGYYSKKHSTDAYLYAKDFYDGIITTHRIPYELVARDDFQLTGIN